MHRVEEVLHMVDECRLHMVQLHGDETPKYCEKIADYVSVVKAFRLSDNDNIEWMIRALYGCVRYVYVRYNGRRLWRHRQKI